MKLTEVLKGYRLVDLSETVEQGRSAGPTGEQRWYFTRMFPFPPGQVGGEWMHVVVMESHVGTHVEAPAHWIDAAENREGAGKDVAQVPITSYFGEAVLIRCGGLPDAQPITPKFLEEEGVRKGDIVVFGLSGRDMFSGRAPYVSDEAVLHMADLPIKMVAFDRTVGVEDMPRFMGEKDVRKRFLGMTMHRTFCRKEIPIIECICNLEKLTRKRFFLFAWPAPMKGLESFVVRAVAFEPANEERR
ncbi:MAG: cyclase family protein [Candidatus Brockarchaeota archaeon]|nr:cyclase family protein [Candidatus Brockarchaeota archaeon]